MYDESQTAKIYGLLNNRGYTFISTSTEFEKLNEITLSFISEYFQNLNGLITKEDIETKVSSFEQLDDLKKFIV